MTSPPISCESSVFLVGRRLTVNRCPYLATSFGRAAGRAGVETSRANRSRAAAVPAYASCIAGDRRRRRHRAINHTTSAARMTMASTHRTAVRYRSMLLPRTRRPPSRPQPLHSGSSSVGSSPPAPMVARWVPVREAGPSGLGLSEWALRVSNLRPSPRKGEEEVLVRGWSREVGCHRSAFVYLGVLLSRYAKCYAGSPLAPACPSTPILAIRGRFHKDRA
jgi:hypothetical protein